MLDEVMTLSPIKNKDLQLHSTRDWISKTTTLLILPWNQFVNKSYSKTRMTFRFISF